MADLIKAAELGLITQKSSARIPRNLAGNLEETEEEVK